MNAAPVLTAVEERKLANRFRKHGDLDAVLPPGAAAILAVAASEATVLKGASLLAVYSLGLGIPFVLAALLAEPFAASLAALRLKKSELPPTMSS